MSKKLEQLKERLALLEKKTSDYKEKNKPKYFKSQLITCKSCTSKINKKYIRSYDCPVCGKSMMSDTVSKTLDRYEDQALELRKKIAVERLKVNNKKSSSKKAVVKSAYQDSIEEVYDRYDDILADTDYGDFREIVGEIGGDVETIRVYKNGNIYAK